MTALANKTVTQYMVGLMGLMVPVIMGTLWIGAVSSTATSASNEVHELRSGLQNVPADIAVLKSQSLALQAQIQQVRNEQQVRDAELLAAIKARK